MIRRTVSLMLIYTFLLVASPASASSAGAVTIPPSIFRAWLNVARCETGLDWDSQGSIYSGGLGVSNTNWTKYRLPGMPLNAGLASPQQQIQVAMRINQGYPVPDSQGCQGW